MPIIKTANGARFEASADNKSIKPGDLCIEAETGFLFQCKENLIEEQDCIIDTEGKAHITGHDPHFVYKVVSRIS